MESFLIVREINLTLWTHNHANYPFWESCRDLLFSDQSPTYQWCCSSDSQFVPIGLKFSVPTARWDYLYNLAHDIRVHFPRFCHFAPVVDMLTVCPFYRLPPEPLRFIARGLRRRSLLERIAERLASAR
jgi:hypothetical protein